MTGIEIIFFCGIALALFVVDAWHDSRQIKRNIYINYALHFVLVLIPFTWLYVVALIGGLDPAWLLSSIAVLPFVRWFVHDYVLNLFRGLPLHYLGERSKTDKLLRFCREELGVAPFFIRLTGLLIGLSFGHNIFTLWESF